jgi:hypothetical protein
VTPILHRTKPKSQLDSGGFLVSITQTSLLPHPTVGASDKT